MTKNFEKKVFKKGSTTYYFSAKFFPKRIRRDIARLYSFVRIANDYVLEEPRQPEKIAELTRQYKEALKTEHFDPTTHSWDDQDTKIVKNMMRLTQRYKFDPNWVESFLEAMKADIQPKAASTLSASLEYVKGSGEVIGLMLAKILKLPEEAWEAAKLQGRAMQWLNFLRDLPNDIKRGRQYFPDEDLKASGLADFSEEAARANPEAFKKFVDIQLKRYREWQLEAEKGYEHLPKRYRIPLQTAAEMHNWTAKVIKRQPMLIFRKKIMPRQPRVLIRGAIRKARQLIR